MTDTRRRWTRTARGKVAHLAPDTTLTLPAILGGGHDRYTRHPHAGDRWVTHLIHPAPSDMTRCTICLGHLADLESLTDHARRRWAEEELAEHIDQLVEAKAKHAPF